MNEAWIRAVVLACTFGAVLLAVEAIISWAGSSREASHAVNQRLKLIGQGRTRSETHQLLRRASIEDLEGTIPPALLPFAVRLDRLLVSAQIRAPIGRVVMALVIAPLALFFLFVFASSAGNGAITLGRSLMMAALAIGIGALLPILLIQMKANRTRKKMEAQFPVALDVFVRGLRAGHPIASALDLLTVEMPDPIGSEFGIVVDEVTYGADLRDALQGMAERWDMDDMRMFVVSLSVQSETGGNLAEILENLSTVIRERASMMMKVRALSSEGRMTAVMLTLLPVMTFVALFFLNPRFYFDVADDPAFVPSFGVLIAMYAIGFYMIRRMIDLKV